MASKFKDGSVKIADEILDQIALEAAKEVYGVDKDHSDDSFIESLQARQSRSKIRNVEGNLLVDLDLALNKNVNVRKTVKKVQHNVKNVLETMTGINVNRVNVNINRLEV